MLVFFDTETTGVTEYEWPLDDSRQPHILQFAATWTDDLGKPIGKFSTLVALPEHVTVPEEAFKVHGISTKDTHLLGLPIVGVLGTFYRLAQKAHRVVAHNAKFDRRMMEVAWHRINGGSLGDHIPDEKWHCTAEQATPILKLPPTKKMIRAGYYKNKTPNLAECVRHFFDEPLDGAHDALVDVEACQRIYFAMNPTDPAAQEAT